MLLEALEQSSVSANGTAYSCVLEVCVACNDRKAAEGLLKRMASVGRTLISRSWWPKALATSRSAPCKTTNRIVSVGLPVQGTETLEPQLITTTARVHYVPGSMVLSTSRKT